MITHSILALTALIMAIIAYFTYINTPRQKSETEKALSEKENEVIVFKTKRQRTKIMLDKDKKKIICYLKDIKNNINDIQWTINQTQAKDILEKKNLSINSNYKVNVGTFSVGLHKNWLYSKKIFPDPKTLELKLYSLLKMIN